jgi:transposase InsO family protein
VTDALANGRALRALTVVDGFTREAPAIEVDGSLPARRVTRVLDGVIAERGSAVQHPPGQWAGVYQPVLHWLGAVPVPLNSRSQSIRQMPSGGVGRCTGN